MKRRNIPDFVKNILEPMNRQEGDSLPVSAFQGMEDGPSGRVVLAQLPVAPPSSLRIVPVPELSSIVAPLGLKSEMEKFSAASLVPSRLTRMLVNFWVWPGMKVNVPCLKR